MPPSAGSRASFLPFKFLDLRRSRLSHWLAMAFGFSFGFWSGQALATQSSVDQRINWMTSNPNCLFLCKSARTAHRTTQDSTQTHQGTWGGVAVLSGLSKKRESARMGANGTDGADGPDGADGAIGTNATDDRRRRRITIRKDPAPSLPNCTQGQRGG